MIEQIGVLLGGQENTTRQAAQGIVDFEHKLAAISTPDDQRRDDNDLYHSMTINELSQLAPFVCFPSRCMHSQIHKALDMPNMRSIAIR